MEKEITNELDYKAIQTDTNNSGTKFIGERLGVNPDSKGETVYATPIEKPKDERILPYNKSKILNRIRKLAHKPIVIKDLANPNISYELEVSKNDLLKEDVPAIESELVSSVMVMSSQAFISAVM